MKKRYLIIGGLIVSLIIAIILGNRVLSVTIYDVYSDKLDLGNEITIVQISDLHNTEFGNKQERLFKKIVELEPDLIVITGDIIDSRKTKINIAIDLIAKVKDIAPIYFVTGNHEAKIGNQYETLKQEMISLGVNVLDDSIQEVIVNDTVINIIGVNDPTFAKEISDLDEEIIRTNLQNIEYDSSKFNLLLSHRPELFQVYVDSGVDLVLTGHAHGGQFRIPFIGGVISPNQGFFPKYSEGLFEKDNTKMIVNRGLGNSIIPFRVNNLPEIVVVKLKGSSE